MIAYTVIASALSVEFVKRVLHYSLQTQSAIHIAHIHVVFFVLPFMFLYIAGKFWITGIRFPRAHKWIAYFCFVFGLGTVAMGEWLNFLLAAGQ